MKKNLLLILSLAVVGFSTMAADYVTPGEGTTYTLESLSKIEGSGVTAGENEYVMANNITIAAADKFVMTDGITLKMGNEVILTVEGLCDFNLTEGSTITKNADTDEPGGVYFASDFTDDVTFANVSFEYAALRIWRAAKTVVRDCSFKSCNNVLSTSAALNIGPSDAVVEVYNSEFISNSLPAISMGANIAMSLTVDGCYFEDNNTANSNKPQLNLTVGGNHDIVLKNSQIIGAKREKVGAFAVSNFMGITGTNTIIVENCEIRSCRYGLAFQGPMNVVAKNNTIVDNKYETNPMAGGSGINLYDPTGATTAYVEGNHIEGSLWGVTIVGCGAVNLGKIDDPLAADYNPGNNVFKDNGNNGVLYDVYNNTANLNFAQGNTWNVDEQTQEKIETVVFHKNDDASLGELVYMPNYQGVSVVELQKCYFNQQSRQIVGVDGNAKATIYNVGGATVAQTVAVDGVIDLAGLSRGVYLVKITGGNETKVLKCAL